MNATFIVLLIDTAMRDTVNGAGAGAGAGAGVGEGAGVGVGLVGLPPHEMVTAAATTQTISCFVSLEIETSTIGRPRTRLPRRGPAGVRTAQLRQRDSIRA